MDIDALLNGLVDDTEVDAGELLTALISKISARKGRVRAGGRDGQVDIQLANGQEFRISIEAL